MTVVEGAPSAEGAIEVRRGRFAIRLILRLFLYLILSLIALESFRLGLQLRRFVWDITEPLRFVSDTRRQCYWALKSSGPEGFLNQFDKMGIENRSWDIWLDYAPLRLLVMEEWGRYLRQRYPDVLARNPYDAWQPSYEFSAPVLHFNEWMDVLAAIGAFLLTRFWVRRGSDHPAHFTGAWHGLGAALIVWFNPGILLSAYGWPTWDAWIVPMYLLGAFLASVDMWFCAGLAIAVGAMLKGQQLAVAPVFVIWPLITGRLGAAVRWVLGLILGIAVIASPWLLSYIPPSELIAARQVQRAVDVAHYPPALFAIPRTVDYAAIFWIAILLVSLAAVAAQRRKIVSMPNRRARSIWICGASLLILVAAMWPCLIASNRALWAMVGGGAIVLAAIAILLPLKHLRYLLAGSLGISLLSCIALFHGSAAWWNCAFTYGAERWHWLASGLTDNIPGLLHERYNWWPNPDQIVFTLPAVGDRWTKIFRMGNSWPAQSVDISAKIFFNSLYAFFLVVTCVGIGLRARRKSSRMLIALVAPWLMFFLLPVEIHGRYLLYAAGVSAICIGESVGFMLLGFCITLAAFIQILDGMLLAGDRARMNQLLALKFPRFASNDLADKLFRFTEGTHPDLVWALIVIAGVFLYATLSRERKPVQI